MPIFPLFSFFWINGFAYRKLLTFVITFIQNVFLSFKPAYYCNLNYLHKIYNNYFTGISLFPLNIEPQFFNNSEGHNVVQ